MNLLSITFNLTDDTLEAAAWSFPLVSEKRLAAWHCPEVSWKVLWGSVNYSQQSQSGTKSRTSCQRRKAFGGVRPLLQHEREQGVMELSWGLGIPNLIHVHVFGLWEENLERTNEDTGRTCKLPIGKFQVQGLEPATFLLWGALFLIFRDIQERLEKL